MKNGWHKKSEGSLHWFELAISDRLLVAFTTRKGGLSRPPYSSLNASFDVGDLADHVTENRLRIRRSLHLRTLITLRQVHGDAVIPVCDYTTPPDLIEGDALVTSEPGLGMGIMVADCLPVYIYADDLRCAGVAHCGWRGTVRRVAEKLARTIMHRYSVRLADLRFAFGPCICPNCLTVGEDVWQAFRVSFPTPERFLPLTPDPDGRSTRLLDLREANRHLLRDLGLTEAGSLDACSRENDDEFYSVRRERTTGRNLAVIALR